MNDLYYMKLALGLAERGWGRTAPNPMVGAVVVRGGHVVGKGWHRAVGLPHAEVEAIDDAGELAAGATLYVTLEPCNHTGRTPPCTEKILTAGIREVVIAMADPNPDVEGGGAAYLRSKGVRVREGILEAEAQQLNEVFVKHTRTKRPFVVMKSAATLDGRLATRSGDAKWVTGPDARRFVHQLRDALDAIMVGIKTVRADDPSLTTRLDRPGRDPIRIILDTHLSIPEQARVLHLRSESPTWIITGPDIPADKKERVEQAGARVVMAPLRDGRIDLVRLMDQLGEMQVTSILLEGGATVNAAALKCGIVDKFLLFLAPKILGGDDGVPIFRGESIDLMRHATVLERMRFRKIAQDLLIEGYPGNVMADNACDRPKNA